MRGHGGRASVRYLFCRYLPIGKFPTRCDRNGSGRLQHSTESLHPLSVSLTCFLQFNLQIIDGLIREQKIDGCLKLLTGENIFQLKVGRDIQRGEEECSFIQDP